MLNSNDLKVIVIIVLIVLIRSLISHCLGVEININLNTLSFLNSPKCFLRKKQDGTLRSKAEVSFKEKKDETLRSKVDNTSDDVIIASNDVISTNLRSEHWYHLWRPHSLSLRLEGLFQYA